MTNTIFLNVLEESLNEIYMFDAETLRFLYVNKGALNNLGYPLDAMKAMTPLDIKPELDEISFRDLIAPLHKHEQEKLVFQTTHRRADKSLYPVEVHLQLIETQQEHVFLAIMLDITERKRHEDALQKAHDDLEFLVEERTADLKESEEKYRRLVETSTDAIISINEKEEIIQWNEAAFKIFGYSKDEMIGELLDLIIPEKYKSKHNEGFRRYLETGEEKLIGRTAEFMGLRNDKTLVPIEMSLSSIRRDGSIIITGIIRDITARKRMEAELEKMHKLESIGILAGGIAHDFNNILTAILGNISLSKMYVSPDDKIFKKLTDAENACEIAKELASRLMTFSKGGGPFRKTVSISDTLRDAVTLSLSGSNIVFEFELSENLYPVEIDEVQMKQAITNIVINAREAMPEGGLLKVNATNITANEMSHIPLKSENYVMISIADTGKGIPLENLPKIFDPYFTTKGMGAEKGMGLGLSICYSIVKKHEGLITVDSKVGEGTVFHIYLPASGKKTIADKGT